VNIANGMQQCTVDSELWYAKDEAAKAGHWFYFRRYSSAQPGEAERRVEADFKQWVEGQLEATESERGCRQPNGELFQCSKI
jgi:hypothetical protein